MTDFPRERLLVVLVAPALIALMLTLFAWPSSRLSPRNLPIGVVGTPDGVPLAGSSFSVHPYADELAARRAIEQRDVYGAVVESPRGTTVLVASAAGLFVAQLLQRTFAADSASGPPIRVVDVVPADPQDPRGAALASSVLPLVLAGIVAGAALGLGLRPGVRQAAALLATALLAGLVAVGIAQGWLGVLGGSWVANAGVFALTVLAIAAPTAGLGALLGRPGLGLVAGLMMVIGNPFSAINAAPELLPQPVGTIGQLLPPGAGGNLLRSTAFFDGAAAASHVTVLLVWAALGLAATLIAARRSGATSRRRAGSERSRSAPALWQP